MNFKRTTGEVGFARAQGRILYDLRMSRDMTREQLAEASGVHHQRIFRIEMGDSTARTYDLALLADAMNIPLAYLFPDAPQREPVQRTASSTMLERQAWQPEGAFA